MNRLDLFETLMPRTALEMADEIMRIHAELLSRIQPFDLDLLYLFLLVRAADKPWRPSDLYPHFLNDENDIDNVSGMLNRRVETLEERGLIERRRDVPGDRRGVTIHLTPAGFDMVGEIRILLMEVLGEDRSKEFMDGLFS